MLPRKGDFGTTTSTCGVETSLPAFNSKFRGGWCLTLVVTEGSAPVGGLWGPPFHLRVGNGTSHTPVLPSLDPHTVVWA